MRPATRFIAHLAATTFAALVLSACETPYMPYSRLRDGGYSEQPVAPHTWRVRFKGNEQTPVDQSADFALLRAAEICLGDGRPYMRGSNFWTEEKFSSSSLRPTLSALPRNPPPGGSDAPIMVPTISGPPAVSGRLLYTPISDLTVTCAIDSAPDWQDAEALAATMRARYRIAR